MGGKFGQVVPMRSHSRRVLRSGFGGFRFPPDVILVAVRWLCGTDCRTATWRSCWLSGEFTVDHVTIFRWVQRFTPLLIEAARSCRHATGDRWFVDETYLKVARRWVYLYQAIDQFG